MGIVHEKVFCNKFTKQKQRPAVFSSCFLRCIDNVSITTTFSSSYYCCYLNLHSSIPGSGPKSLSTT